jgi:hypothetical protein
VEVSSDSLLAASSASIGEVLNPDRIANLPLVGNNVLDLVRILPGYRQGPGGLLGAQLDTFAGTPASAVNTTRDGISVTDGRFINGVYSTTTINPDLVGEVRLILAPVDAESGRGSAQIQIQTRSGSNAYTGSAAWYVRNSALNPNTWANNHTGAKPNWFNNHEYTVAYGGPIKIPGVYDGKNKTFFYALWDQNIRNTRDSVVTTVLTDTARQGIFRYFPFWAPEGYLVNSTIPNQKLPVAAATASWVAVDVTGNPVAPPSMPDGSPYTQKLTCFSVFGNQRLDASGSMVPFTAADCPGGTIISSPARRGTRIVRPSTARATSSIRCQHATCQYFGDSPTDSADGLNTRPHTLGERYKR